MSAADPILIWHIETWSREIQKNPGRIESFF